MAIAYDDPVLYDAAANFDGVVGECAYDGEGAYSETSNYDCVESPIVVPPTIIPVGRLPKLPRDPRINPRTRVFLQKAAQLLNPLASGQYALPLPSNVALVDSANVFTQQQQINSWYGSIFSDIDGATITFNLTNHNSHQVTLGGNRTLALTGGQNGQWFEIILRQDAVGSRTVTWFAGILWPGGVVPTLTTTALKRDWFYFKRLVTGVYLGITLGLDF
jgi:hypothetical protein